MELYPAESRLIDTANQYHLWCFLGTRAPFGYDAERCVMEDVGGDGGKQRPFEEKPKDLLTEDQFQEKLADYKKRQLTKAGYSGQIQEILETAHTRRCQRWELIGAQAKGCEELWPAEPGNWCGPCMARVLRMLAKESSVIA